MSLCVETVRAMLTVAVSTAGMIFLVGYPEIGRYG
jgi:hypothetical protein